jgi:DNA end-binding protein Ku
LKTAGQLIEQLTADWKPERYADTFTDAIKELVARKAKAGKTHEIEPLEAPPDEAIGAKVVDLTELLRNSLGKRPGAVASSRRSKRSPPRRTRRSRA